MATDGDASVFPPVTYSLLFLPCLLQAAKAGNNKAAEIVDILNQQNKINSNGSASTSITKKVSRKKWKQIARSALCGFVKNSGGRSQQQQVATQNGEQETEEEQSLQDIDFTMLQLLALNALELTAPASDILLKNRTNNWVQLSGHEGAFSPAAPGTIWKKSMEEHEIKAYKALSNDSMSDMVPKFYRDVEYKGDRFIEMQDLLHSFKNPSIMDIKMGTRTFLESEVQNTKARPDLYEKMIKVDRTAPTEEEHELKAITKLRYMQFRENLSSSSTLGFRIEGFKAESKGVTNDFKLVKTKDEVVEILRQFLGDSCEACKQLIERLKLLQSKFEKSSFFQTHEVIGSSLLIMHDESKAGVWMIDFAKTVPIPDGVRVNHRSNWSIGNHEDGYLYGLENLISIIEQLLAQKLK